MYVTDWNAGDNHKSIQFGLCMFTWLYSLSPLYQNLTDFILYISRRSMRSHASLMPCPIAVCEHISIFWLKSPSTANDALCLACVVLLTASVIPFRTSWSIPNKNKKNSVLYADSTITFVKGEHIYMKYGKFTACLFYRWRFHDSFNIQIISFFKIY